MEFSLPMQNMQHLDFKAASPNLGLRVSGRQKQQRRLILRRRNQWDSCLSTCHRVMKADCWCYGVVFLVFPALYANYTKRCMDPCRSLPAELICLTITGGFVRLTVLLLPATTFSHLGRFRRRSLGRRNSARESRPRHSVCHQ